MRLVQKIRRSEYITQKDIVTIIRKPMFQHSFKSIAKVICKDLNVTLIALKGKAKKRELVIGRQFFCYFARMNTYETLDKIGDFINRDHSTVSYGINKINNNRDLDVIIKKYFYDIERELI